jgi:hypothetical protein
MPIRFSSGLVGSAIDIAGQVDRRRLRWKGTAPHWQDPPCVDLRDWDGVEPWKTSLGTVMTSGQPVLSNTVTPFQSSDVGKLVIVNQNVGTDPRYFAKIASVSNGVATMVDPADGVTPAPCPSTTTNQRMVYGWDETAALQAALNAAAAFNVTGRWCVLPGTHFVSQLIYPTGLWLAGDGWGIQYGSTNGSISDVQGNSGTTIAQIPGSNKDLLRFAVSYYDGTTRFYGPGSIRQVTLLGPPAVGGKTYTGGGGFVMRDVDGNAVCPQDGAFFADIHAIQFYDDGFELPAGGIPLFVDRLRPFYNGRYGINVGAAPASDSGVGGGNQQSMHFLNCTGDGNGEGLLRIHDQGNAGNVVITNLKSEKGTVRPLARVASGAQESAIILENCNYTPVVINGVTHISSGTSNPTDAPGPAILIKASDDRRPQVSFFGVGVRVTSTQTNGLADAVLLRDSVIGVDIPRSVQTKSGHWPPDTLVNPDGMALSSGEANIPRFQAQTTVTMTSQALRLGYFQARKTEQIGKLRVHTGSTPAGATPSLLKFCIYEVLSDGSLNLVGVTANSTGSLVAASTGYTVDLTAAFKKYSGKVYAAGLLVVTAATAPQVSGAIPPSAEAASRTPRLTLALTGQADVPSSISAATVSGSTATNNFPYVVALP